MTKKRAAAIAGVGSYAPAKALTNAALRRSLGVKEEWIRAVSGIEERRIAGRGEATSDLAAKAAKAALKDAGLGALEIDLIIVATQTPDKLFPATACFVQKALGARRAAAFDVSATCAGFVYACAVAAQFIETGFYQTVLVAGAEKLSAFVDPKDGGTRILMGDGAGAVVLRPAAPGQGFLGHVLSADPEGLDWAQLPAGGSRLPSSRRTVDEGLHFLRLDGWEIYRTAVKALSDSVRLAAKKCRVKVSEIDWVFPHQANLRIIEAAAERLGLPMEKMGLNIRTAGNTSAASIPMALDDAYRARRLRRGQLLAFAGVGSGMVWGASLLRWSK